MSPRRPVKHVKKVIIIGAGDHGRGALEIFKTSNQNRFEYDVVGFIDDDPSKLKKKIDEVPVLGPVSGLRKQHNGDLSYILAISQCGVKSRIIKDLGSLSLNFINAIHPTAIIGSDVQMGSGNIIAAGAIIAYNTVFETHITINLNTTVGHDCLINEYVTIAPGANIGGRVRLGKGCDIGPNCTICKGATVGDWSCLGPSTVVLKEIPPKKTYFGNPARPVPRLS